MAYRYEFSLGKRIKVSATADEAAAAKRDWDNERSAQLAEPYPTQVSLQHFMARDLNARIAAGECIVTMSNVFGTKDWFTVIHVAEEVMQGQLKKYEIEAVVRTTGSDVSFTYTSRTLDVEWLTNTSTNEPLQAATIGDMNAETFTLDMANTLQMIAAVAADNGIHNSISAVGDGRQRVQILDGDNNPLSEPVDCADYVSAVSKSSFWGRNYRYGLWRSSQRWPSFSLRGGSDIRRMNEQTAADQAQRAHTLRSQS